MTCEHCRNHLTQRDCEACNVIRKLDGKEDDFEIEDYGDYGYYMYADDDCHMYESDDGYDGFGWVIYNEIRWALYDGNHNGENAGSRGAKKKVECARPARKIEGKAEELENNKNGLKRE